MEPVIQEKIIREIEIDWLKKKRKTSRYNLKSDNKEIKILSIGEKNFLVDKEDSDGLRGSVSVFEGSKQIFDCLIFRSEDFVIFLKPSSRLGTCSMHLHKRKTSEVHTSCITEKCTKQPSARRLIILF